MPRFAILALSLVLLWRIIHVNAVLYEDTGRPRLPALPAFGESAAASQREALFEVLRENPAHAAALLMLARDYEHEGKLEPAARAHNLAVQLAPNDREVLGAAAEFLLRSGNVAEGLTLLGRLVDNFPDSRDSAFPVLAQILASRRHPEAWDAVVARGQDWIGAFILAACNRGVDPSVLGALHMKRVASGRAAPAETACLVDRLRLAGRWQEAYQVWLNTLARERLANVGYVFNGGFEYAPSGIGFDWMPSQRPEREAGHSVQISTTLGAVGQRALRVSYNGKRQAGNAIAQFLALAPGRYQLTGAARPEGMKVGRGVQWTLRCVSEGKPLAPSGSSERFLGSGEWRRFTFDFTVAATCPGQVLQLEPAGAGESAAYLAGTVWFDDLALRRGG